MIPTSFVSIILFGLCSFERLLLTCVRDKDQLTLHIDQSNLLIEMMTCILYLPLSVGIIDFFVLFFLKKMHTSFHNFILNFKLHHGVSTTTSECESDPFETCFQFDSLAIYCWTNLYLTYIFRLG